MFCLAALIWSGWTKMKMWPDDLVEMSEDEKIS